MIRIISSLIFSVLLIAPSAMAESSSREQAKLFKKLWKGKCNAAVTRKVKSPDGSRLEEITIPFTTYNKFTRLSPGLPANQTRDVTLRATADISTVRTFVSGIPLDEMLLRQFNEYQDHSRVDLVNIIFIVYEHRNFITFSPTDTSPTFGESYGFSDGFDPDPSFFSIECK